jgi:phospholipid transport system substrate-binding protein
MPRALLALATLCLLALLAATPAEAGPAGDQLRARIDQVLKVLGDAELRKDGRLPERRAAIRKIAAEIFDFTEITKRSLGRHWQARTPAERAEFVELFTDLLEHTYVSKIEGYSGEKVAFLGETADGGVATVRTRIVTKQGTEIPIDYRMYDRGDRWLAFDVAVEGISLTANYRTQFNALIAKSSYQELVRTMRAKREERAPAPGLARPVAAPAPARAEEPAPPRGRAPQSP